MAGQITIHIIENLCGIWMTQIQHSRKHVLQDHADYAAPTQQHEQDRTDHTDHTYHTERIDEGSICSERSRS